MHAALWRRTRDSARPKKLRFSWARSKGEGGPAERAVVAMVCAWASMGGLGVRVCAVYMALCEGGGRECGGRAGHRQGRGGCCGLSA